MKYNTARRLINKIMKYDCTDIGIFISLLVNIYMKCYDISEKDFMKSLKNSLKIIAEDSNYEKN